MCAVINSSSGDGEIVQGDFPLFGWNRRVTYRWPILSLNRERIYKWTVFHSYLKIPRGFVVVG